MLNRKGFTLVELLAVVFIISALAFVAIPSYMNSLKESRIAEAQMILKKVGEANATFLRDYPNYGITQKITNANTNKVHTNKDCNPADYASRQSSVFTQCGYLNKENWDNSYFDIYVCNPKATSFPTGSCCAKGRYAGMYYDKNKCYYIDKSAELQFIGVNL
ncbi:prepilin-type N-terminal cleavage/methylation domain-containing protein [Elusimicrobium simillimum]|uniref:type IV pilin protein n=1 Tax=Elusimicrobium simillimum TaxID=3143438 RepID=UPI003C6F1792